MFQDVYLRTVQVCAIILGQKFRGTYFIQKSTQQQHKKENTRNSYSRGQVCTNLFIYRTSTIAFFGIKCLSRNLPCTPVHSRELLCVPVNSPCILIGVCLALFVNHMQYCAFATASNWLCHRFDNTMCSECYSLKLALVVRQILIQIGT